MALVSKRVVIGASQLEVAKPPKNEDGVVGLLKIADIEDGDLYLVPLSEEGRQGLLKELQELEGLKVAGANDMPKPPGGVH